MNVAGRHERKSGRYNARSPLAPVGPSTSISNSSSTNRGSSSSLALLPLFLAWACSSSSLVCARLGSLSSPALS